MAINLKKICRDIGNPDEDIQVLALTTIGQLTASSVEDPNDLVQLRKTLEDAANGGNQDVVFLARKALNKVAELSRQIPAGKLAPGEPSAPAEVLSRDEVLASLEGEQDTVRLATGLSQLARVAEPGDVERAIPLLRHGDPRVRANAVEVVERLADDKRITEILTPLLADENNRVKGNVAKALGRIGVPKIAKFLAQMMQSSKLSMRESAVYAISHIAGAPMVDLLIQALRDPYEGIRLRAVRGLKLHNDERAIPHLRPLLNDLDIDVCEEARKAIRVIRKDQPLTSAGMLLDIERIAERDAERRAQEALDAQVDPSIGMTGSVGMSTTSLNKKQQAAELQKQAEALLAKKAAAPALNLDGRGPEELGEMLKFEHKRIGLAVFKRVRVNEISHQQLSLLYYDILKFQETLKRHQERGKAEGKAEGAGFFGSIKAKLSGKPQEEDPIARLERRIDESYMQLGKRAVELARESQVDLEESDLDRVSAIESKLGEPVAPAEE